MEVVVVVDGWRNLEVTFEDWSEPINKSCIFIKSKNMTSAVFIWNTSQKTYTHPNNYSFNRIYLVINFLAQ